MLPNGLVASGPSGNVAHFYNYTTGTAIFQHSNSQSGGVPPTLLQSGKVALGSYNMGIDVVQPSSTGTNFQFRCLGHTGAVTSVAALGSKYIATGSADKTIKIWNATNGILIQTLIGHNGSVDSLLGLPGGRFASGSADKTIKIWNLANCSLVYTLSGQNQVPNLILLPNGLIASGPDPNKLWFWNYNTGTSPYQYNSTASFSNQLALLASGNVAGGNYYGNKVTVVNANSGTALFSLTGHTAVISAIASLSQSLIATGANDLTLRIWNATNGALILTLTGHTNNIVSIVPLPNGCMTSSGDATVKVWNFSTDGLIFIYIYIYLL